jgi:hypothetical protein
MVWDFSIHALLNIPSRKRLGMFLSPGDISPNLKILKPSSNFFLPWTALALASP